MHPSANVKVMMRTIGACMAAALVLLAGCDGGNPTTGSLANSVTPDPGPGSLEPGNPGPGDSPPTGGARAENELGVPDYLYDIDPEGTRGWDVASNDLAGLGALIDDALANLKVSMAEAVLTWEIADKNNPEQKDSMRLQPVILIEDGRTFSITYALPETRASWNRLVGDGSRRSARIDKKWIEQPKFTARRAPKMSRAEVEDWPMSFPEGMFSFFFRSQDAWAPLFSAWQNGVAGYSATVEKQLVRKGTVQRELYRVVAKTEKGDPTEVEIIIDADRMLPLTVRAIRSGPGGGESRIFWTASWAFGGSHDPKEFEIPVPGPES